MYTVWWSDTAYSDYMEDFKTKEEALEHYVKISSHPENSVRLFKELKVKQINKPVYVVEEEQ